MTMSVDILGPFQAAVSQYPTLGRFRSFVQAVHVAHCVGDAVEAEACLRERLLPALQADIERLCFLWVPDDPFEQSIFGETRSLLKTWANARPKLNLGRMDPGVIGELISLKVIDDQGQLLIGPTAVISALAAADGLDLPSRRALIASDLRSLTTQIQPLSGRESLLEWIRQLMTAPSPGPQVIFATTPFLMLPDARFNKRDEFQNAFGWSPPDFRGPPHAAAFMQDYENCVFAVASTVPTYYSWNFAVTAGDIHTTYDGGPPEFQQKYRSAAGESVVNALQHSLRLGYYEAYDRTTGGPRVDWRDWLTFVNSELMILTIRDRTTKRVLMGATVPAPDFLELAGSLQKRWSPMTPLGESLLGENKAWPVGNDLRLLAEDFIAAEDLVRLTVPPDGTVQQLRMFSETVIEKHLNFLHKRVSGAKRGWFGRLASPGRTGQDDAPPGGSGKGRTAFGHNGMVSVEEIRARKEEIERAESLSSDAVRALIEEFERPLASSIEFLDQSRRIQELHDLLAEAADLFRGAASKASSSDQVILDNYSRLYEFSKDLPSISMRAEAGTLDVADAKTLITLRSILRTIGGREYSWVAERARDAVVPYMKLIAYTGGDMVRVGALLAIREKEEYRAGMTKSDIKRETEKQIGRHVPEYEFALGLETLEAGDLVLRVRRSYQITNLGKVAAAVEEGNFYRAVPAKRPSTGAVNGKTHAH